MGRFAAKQCHQGARHRCCQSRCLTCWLYVVFPPSRRSEFAFRGAVRGGGGPPTSAAPLFLVVASLSVVVGLDATRWEHRRSTVHPRVVDACLALHCAVRRCREKSGRAGCVPRSASRLTYPLFRTKPRTRGFTSALTSCLCSTARAFSGRNAALVLCTEQRPM